MRSLLHISLIASLALLLFSLPTYTSTAETPAACLFTPHYPTVTIETEGLSILAEPADISVAMQAGLAGLYEQYGACQQQLLTDQQDQPVGDIRPELLDIHSQLFAILGGTLDTPSYCQRVEQVLYESPADQQQFLEISSDCQARVDTLIAATSTISQRAIVEQSSTRRREILSTKLIELNRRLEMLTLQLDAIEAGFTDFESRLPQLTNRCLQ